MSTTATVPSPYEDEQFYSGVVGRRLFAFVVDVVIASLLMGIIVFVGLIVGFFTFGLGWLLAALLFVSADFLYRWLTIAANSGTWGMTLTGIELRDRRGERLDAGQAFVHTAAFYVVGVGGMIAIPLLLNLVVPFLSPHRRLIHDFLLGTVAINRPV